jgi:cell division protein DivIC
MKLPQLPPALTALLRNFYFSTTLVFLVWMTFFDGNDFLSQYRTWRKLRNAEADRHYYEEKISEVKQNREELLGNKQLLEKFAREQYLMKKPTEDVYIIESAD